MRGESRILRHYQRRFFNRWRRRLKLGWAKRLELLRTSEQQVVARFSIRNPLQQRRAADCCDARRRLFTLLISKCVEHELRTGDAFPSLTGQNSEILLTRGRSFFGPASLLRWRSEGEGKRYRVDEQLHEQNPPSMGVSALWYLEWSPPRTLWCAYVVCSSTRCLLITIASSFHSSHFRFALKPSKGRGRGSPRWWYDLPYRGRLFGSLRPFRYPILTPPTWKKAQNSAVAFIVCFVISSVPLRFHLLKWDNESLPSYTSLGYLSPESLATAVSIHWCKLQYSSLALCCAGELHPFLKIGSYKTLLVRKASGLLHDVLRRFAFKFPCRTSDY